MSPLNRKVRLLVYKTSLDQDKFRLLDMSRRYFEIGETLPDAIRDDASDQVDNYARHLRSALNACDAALKTIDKELTEIQ